MQALATFFPNDPPHAAEALTRRFGRGAIEAASAPLCSPPLAD
jgi:hypothetical protein